MRESGIIAIRPWDICGWRGVKKRFFFFLVVKAWWDLRSGVQKQTSKLYPHTLSEDVKCLAESVLRIAHCVHTFPLCIWEFL